MENITKALIIAAGIMIAIMIVSLIVVFWNQISGYYAEQHNSQIIEQNTKFNAQFENYNKQEIRGNELISAMNKVINYNTSIADMEGYDRVVMVVSFMAVPTRPIIIKNINSFKYNEADDSIFGNSIYTYPCSISNEKDDSSLKKITQFAGNLTAETGLTEEQLQKLSAQISSIVIDENKEIDKNTRYVKLKNILGTSKANEVNGNQTKMNTIIDATKQYYQYTQLKRAMFECLEVKYNTTENGRVNKITFRVQLDDNFNVKFN